MFNTYYMAFFSEYRCENICFPNTRELPLQFISDTFLANLNDHVMCMSGKVSEIIIERV